MAELMNRSGKGLLHALAPLFLLGLLTGCAGTQEGPETFSLPAGEGAVALTAASYSFSPESITARAGEKLVLLVKNTSGSDHNITIESPDGRTLRSVDLPAREKISVTILLEKAGKYPFYCDQPFHTTLGMEGEIRAR